MASRTAALQPWVHSAEGAGGGGGGGGGGGVGGEGGNVISRIGTQQLR